MRSLRVYIAGPVDGVTNPQDRFSHAERLLADRGHHPVNPLVGAPAGASWKDHMKRDIRLLLECDAIYLQDGWETSPGARLEAHLAEKIGIPRFYTKQVGPGASGSRPGGKE